MVVLSFICLACTLAGLAYGFGAYVEVSKIRDENYALKQEGHAARERCEKLVTEANYLQSRIAMLRNRHDSLDDEVANLRTEMANIHACLKTNLTKRRLKEWQALARELTAGAE